jgi:hypothetical protein
MSNLLLNGVHNCHIDPVLSLKYTIDRLKWAAIHSSGFLNTAPVSALVTWAAYLAR